MRIVVYGAGAIGGLLGGRLVQAGHEVVLVARGAHHDAIRDRGLRIVTHGESATVDVAVVDHPAGLRWRDDDVVVLAMKGQHTPEALDALEADAPSGITVVCAQNGVDNERRALRRFPHVVAMCVVCPAGHLEPGVVEAYSAPWTGVLDLGRYPGSVGDVEEELAAVIRTATYDSVARADVMRWKHTKLVVNLGNAVQALCGTDLGDEGAAALVRMARDEGEACLAAAGVPFASREEDLARRGDMIRLDPALTRRFGWSTWQSLERGTGSVETDLLNGEIVLLGRLHGFPTPVNALLRDRMAALVRAGAPPGSVPATTLLAALGERTT